MKRIAAILFVNATIIGAFVYAKLPREEAAQPGAVIVSAGNSLLPMDDKVIWSITLPREAHPEATVTMQIWRVSASLDDLSRIDQPMSSIDDAERVAYSNSTRVRDAYPEGRMAIQLINLHDLGIDTSTETSWRVAGGYSISPGIGQIQYRKDFLIGDKIASNSHNALWEGNILHAYDFITTTEDTRFRYDVVLTITPPDEMP